MNIPTKIISKLSRLVNPIKTHQQRIEKLNLRIDHLQQVIEKQQQKHIALKDNMISTRKRLLSLKDRLLKLEPHRHSQKYLAACFNFAEKSSLLDKGTSFDLCVAHSNNSLCTAFEFSSRNNSPVIFDAVEIPQLEHRSGVYAGRFKKDYRGANLIATYEKSYIEKIAGVSTVSPGLKDWLVKLYNLPNPILLRNCREFDKLQENSTIRDHCGLKNGEILILYIGLIYRNQRPDMIISSLVRLPVNFHFALLGTVSDAYKEELIHLSHTKEVAQRVHFLKPIKSKELTSYANGADIGIIASQPGQKNIEISLPNRFFEMVMARLPIVVAPLPDMQNLIEEIQTGLVFNQQDPTSIAETVQELYARSQAKDFKLLLENAAATLCWEKEKENLVKLVKEVMGEHEKKSVAIFANKQIKRNNRIYRICKTLTKMNLSVTLFAKNLPEPDLFLPEVTYHAISNRPEE